MTTVARPAIHHVALAVTDLDASVRSSLAVIDRYLRNIAPAEGTAVDTVGT
jgi:hypothetical protein